MAILNITYYSNIGSDGKSEAIQVGDEPNLGGELLTYTTTTDSAAFPTDTKFVRLIADDAAFITFGATGVSGVGSSLKLVADQAEYFSVSGASSGNLLLAASIDGVT